MKVAYVTTYDARDRYAFSGRGYYMATALEQVSVAVEYIGPLVDPRSLLRTLKEYFYNNRLSRVRYTRERDAALIRDYARQVSAKLAGLDVDVVLSSLSLGSQPVAYLECDKPIVIWTDSTLAAVINFYPEFSNLCRESIRDGLANERSALERCRIACYWSDWAARTAVENHHLEPSKVKVVPVGPLLDVDWNLAQVKAWVDERPTTTCRLVFLGAAWHRKGGDIALEVARRLRSSGLETELSVVGCSPILDEPIPPFVKVWGFVSKKTTEGLRTLLGILSRAHFLILPSRAEAFGQVFCEASSLGVPSLATSVGGIPTAVRDDINGKTFSLDASVDEYLGYISNLFAHYSAYRDLALSSYHEYETRLNWKTAGLAMKQLLDEVVDDDRHSRGS